MPPHCDTLDGPVVTAARRALDMKNVNLILPFVHKPAEAELRKAFDRSVALRTQGKAAKDLADLWFFETAVRLHREGEGAPYTGLKPAGLDWGPVVPKAEKALEKGNPKEVVSLLTGAVEHALHERFERAMSLKDYDEDDVGAAREYVGAALGFQLYSHHLYEAITHGEAHGEGGEKGHEH